MKWANTGGDDINCGSVRVVSTLLKIHNSLIQPTDTFEICQNIQYCFGSSLFSVWKLEAIIVCCFENRCSAETLEVLQTLFWKLMRGDVRTVSDLTVHALRGTKDKPCGLVHLICMRRVMIKDFLGRYPDDHVLVRVFGCMATFNSFFPSERQMANSIRLGKPTALDSVWKL